MNALLPIKDETKVVRLAPIDGVLGQGGLPPGIDAADAMDVQVDVQVDETAALDFVGTFRARSFLNISSIISGVC